MDPTIGLLAGTGWASGINLYGVVLLLGVLGRVGWSDDVPELLTRPEVLALAGGLYLLEFVIDKVPYLDDLWDVVHTAAARSWPVTPSPTSPPPWARAGSRSSATR